MAFSSNRHAALLLQPGGGERVRTDDLLRARQALSQLSYTPNPLRLVGLGGLEPPTSRLSGVRSNQLSYAPKPMLGLSFIKEKRVTRIELATTAWKAVVLPLNYTR